MSSMQQRKNEILAKRAKLAELKKQRELRQKEFTNNRNSVGDASEVTRPEHANVMIVPGSNNLWARLFRQLVAAPKTELNWMT